MFEALEHIVEATLSAGADTVVVYGGAAVEAVDMNDEADRDRVRRDFIRVRVSTEELDNEK